MTSQSWRRCRCFALAVCIALAGAATGCVAYNPVPLRDGAFPRGAVQVGEEVRLTTRAGEALSFEVAGVEESGLLGSRGERVAAGDLASLEVKRLNKRATIIAASIVGGVVGTALLIDTIEDEDYCNVFDDDCDFR